MSWRGPGLLGLCLLMGVLQVLLLIPTFGVSLNSIPDEGTVALQAMNVLKGLVPHRDYFILTPISSDYWVGAWFFVFGTSLESLRCYFILEMAVAAAALQYFSARLLPRGWSELAPLCFMCHAPFCWYIPSPRWDAGVFLLLALCLIHGPPRRLIFSGILVAMAALTQHPAGAAGAAGITLALVLQREAGWPAVRAFWGGILLLWLPFLGFLWAHDLVANFLNDTIYFTLNNYVAAHKVSVDWSSFLPNFVAAGQTWQAGGTLNSLLIFGYAVVDLVTYGGWFALTSLIVLLSLKLRRRELLCLALCLAFLTLLEAVRPNRYHFTFHMPFVLLALFYLLHRLGKVGAVISAFLLACHALVALGHVRSVQMSNIPVAMPMGTTYVREQGRAQALHQILQVNSSFPPAEKLFVFPDDPELQWLLGRGPATRDVAALPCFYSYPHFQSIREGLRQDGVENLLFVPMVLDFTAYPTISQKDHDREQKWLLEFLGQGYRPYKQAAGLTFYRRQDLP